MGKEDAPTDGYWVPLVSPSPAIFPLKVRRAGETHPSHFRKKCKDVRWDVSKAQGGSAQGPAGHNPQHFGFLWVPICRSPFSNPPIGHLSSVSPREIRSACFSRAATPP